MEICHEAKLPYVMAETNSCYNAGKKGVSDVFASALWALDYLLQLAAAGQRGVYFHGGANGWYTPIAGGAGIPFQARPIFYGLQMASGLVGAELAIAETAAETANISVYALRHPWRLVVINKGAAEITVKLQGEPAGASLSAIQVQRLCAPSVDAREQITLSTERLGRFSPLAVRGFSAAVFHLQ